MDHTINNKLVIFSVICFLLLSQLSYHSHGGDVTQDQTPDLSFPKSERELSEEPFSSSAQSWSSSVTPLPSSKLRQEENLSLVNQPFVFYRPLENGDIYSNGTHYQASITTKPIRLPSLAYYALEQLNSSTYYYKSAYGCYYLTKQSGILLTNCQTNATIFTSETWFGSVNDIEIPAQDITISLKEQNPENLTIQRFYDWGNPGFLNLTYSFIRGYLKLTAELYSSQARSNVRVGVRYTGLDQFTKQDLTHYNTSKYMINFEDMLDKIDEVASSFNGGTLELVSTSFSILAGGTKSFDPTIYETSDANDFYLEQHTDLSYVAQTGQTLLQIGNATSNNWRFRSIVSFDLYFIDYYSTIINASFSLYLADGLDAGTTTNISALGYSTAIQPPNESTISANSTVFNDDYLHNGSNYNITITLGTIANKYYDWNTTDFVQEWINSRTVNNIGWQLRQINDQTTQDRCSWNDASAGSNVPKLTVFWVTDTLSPVVDLQTDALGDHEWSNNNTFVLNTYDQPTSSAAGLNLSSLAYSVDGDAWTTVPSAKVSISDNTTFPTQLTVTDLVSETTGTIAFRIADLQGNWGYSNSSFGKQYYPQFTGTYAYQNTTANSQIGWSEEWTETTTGWGSIGAVGGTISNSLTAGIFNNAINNSHITGTTQFINPTLTITSFSIVNFDKLVVWFNVKVSTTFTTVTTDCNIILQTTTSDFIRLENIGLFLNSINGSGWQKLELPISDQVSQTGSFDYSNVIRIQFRFKSTGSNFAIGDYFLVDGLHFENIDGDSCTESITCLGGVGTWNGLSVTLPKGTSTDNQLGYESVYLDTTSTAFTSSPVLKFSSNIDLSDYNSFTLKIKSNITVGFSRFEIGTTTAHTIIYTDVSDITTTWKTYSLNLNTDFAVGSGAFNQSSVNYILIRIQTVSARIYFDALNFYSSNQTYAYDATAPTIDSFTLTEEATNSPFDNLYYNGSELFYSNDQTMNNSFSVTLSASDALSGLKTINSTEAFGNSQNQTYTATLTWYINSGETSGDIVVEVYDYAGNSASRTINLTLDNTAPTSFLISTAFRTFAVANIFVNITESTDSSSGIWKYSITTGYRLYNFSTYGNQQLAGVPNGLISLYGLVYDQVGNSADSNTLGILLNYQYQTVTISNVFDPMDVIDQIIGPSMGNLFTLLLFSLILVSVIILIRRFTG